MIQPLPMNRLGIAAAGLLVLLTGAADLKAQTPEADLKAVTQMSRDFLTGISIGSEGAATSSYEELLKDGPLRDHVDKIAARTKEELAKKKYGEFIGEERGGIELVQSKAIGRDVILLRYLYKFEKYPLVWYFTYYRPGRDKSWVVVTVRFDTELELLGLGVTGK